VELVARGPEEAAAEAELMVWREREVALKGGADISIPSMKISPGPHFRK